MNPNASGGGLNKGDGTLTEGIDAAWPGFHYYDKHGAAWADVDNDGDEDLFMVAGAANGAGSTPNHSRINYIGFLVDETYLRGLEYPLARGRMPIWLDWNGDGLLDTFESAEISTQPSSPAPFNSAHSR